ncbi:MAG TPA: hypothetical protein QF753_20725 [Victivallales bacterium]|nr:hypothetical protein [Victivallales bacterium]
MNKQDELTRSLSNILQDINIINQQTLNYSHVYKLLRRAKRDISDAIGFLNTDK